LGSVGFRPGLQVDGRNCLLVVPKIPAAGKPWVWRTEFFGHEPQGDIALLGKGFHIAYMDVQNMYGAPVALDHMDKFYAHLREEYGLASKTVLEGFSRGGLFAFNWAARNPDKVAALYADVPLCDFKSWPGGKGKASKEDRELGGPITLIAKSFCDHHPRRPRRTNVG
jgi:pimeloyl-ACP methyl ester carboxylesterase